ncbi:hypothetical protein GE061_017519 [Apolygus lucorum]|uniref:Uncharacterized protein n=1 Tax=Apolygus lucorum TaxID=248454 RepID=A0A8S9XCK0_APOLU|nr:hypothetical protein GE061_017519 [Apolygus lucorum]
MEAPGSSVFQGAGSIVIDNAGQRQEEEEFLVEEQNRKAELENVMKTAFDDLEDDDNESSITSSHYSSRHDFRQRLSFDEAEESSNERSFHEQNGLFRNHSNIQENFAPDRLYRQSRDEKPSSNERLHQLGYETPPSSDPSAPFQNVRVDLEVVTEAYKQTDVNSYEQLHILYDLRMREIERLRKEIEAEQRSKDQVLRKLAVAETEKQEIISALKNNQLLLEESSEKVKALNREVTTVQEELKQVSKEKDETKHELDIAKLQILQQEQQIALLEKCGSLKNQDKHIDTIVENLKERHKREICSVKKELDDALAKVRLKDESYKLLEGRLEEVEKKHVAMLLNKCDSTVRQEAAVKALLDEANSEKVHLTKKIRALESDLETVSKDLEFYENISKNKLLSSTSSDEMDNEDMSLGYGRRVGDQKTSNNMGLLKSELNRALIGQKEKRMTIRKLQEHVQSKEIQIAQMREQEKIYLTETEKLKAEMAAVLERFGKGADESEKRDLIEKITRLEQLISVLDKEKNEKATRVGELEDEVSSLKFKVAEHEEAAKKLVQDYMAYREQEIGKLKMENEELSKNNELEWRTRMERLLGECDEIKRLYLDMRSARDEAVEKLEEEKKKYFECSKTCRALEERIKSLKLQVSDLEDHVISIEEEKDNLLRQQGGQDLGTRKSDYIVKQLREEIAVLKSQPQPQTFDPADLQKLRDEVYAAKTRYLDLEASLKNEFEENVLTLKLENEKLKSKLRNYEIKLNAVEEASSQTETYDEEALHQRVISEPSRRFEDFEKLHTELERMRELEIRRCEEIMILKASFQQKLHEKMEELEAKLLPHSQDDIESVTEKVRTVTTQYYVNEMAKLRDLHKAELEAVNNSKEQESEKVRHLESELRLKLNELESVENLKTQLNEQQSMIQDVKTRTAMIISNCAKEFEEVKEQKEQLLKQLEALTSKSQKYKEAALKYKKLFEQIKANDLPQKYQRLVALVESKESEIITKIQEVAEAYQAQHDPFRNHPPI